MEAQGEVAVRVLGAWLMSQDGKKVDAFSLEAGVPKIEGEIQPKPKYADRISKRIIAVGLAVAVLMVGIFFASLEAMDHKKKDARTRSRPRRRSRSLQRSPKPWSQRN